MIAPCWSCRGEVMPVGPQRLEQCPTHLQAEVRKLMGLDMPHISADALPYVEDD